MIWNNIIKLYGEELFTDIELPTGLDKELVVDTINDECMLHLSLWNDKEILIPKIEHFFKANKKNYERLYNTYQLEYEVLNNYDSTETYSHESSGSGNQTSDNINKVSPFDTTEMVNDSSNASSVSTDNTSEDSYTRTRKGNIGVTTSAQLIKGDIDVWKNFNIYKYIAKDFFSEFVLSNR